jgi:hypothetical protein
VERPPIDPKMPGVAILTLKKYCMSQFLEQKDLFDGVLQLKEEEKQDPMLVIERFFGDYRLYECRDRLWTMVETCLTTDNEPFNDAEERGNLLLHYRDLERLLEACALLRDSRRLSEKIVTGKSKPA